MVLSSLINKSLYLNTELVPLIFILKYFIFSSKSIP